MRGHVKKRCPTPPEPRCPKSCEHTWAYWVDLPRADDGRRRQLTKSGYATRKEAEAGLTGKLLELDKGHHIDGSKDTLSVYLQAWLAGLDRKPATLETYRGVVARHLDPILGKNKLQRLTPVLIKAAYRTLLDGRDGIPALSPTTVQLVHQVLSKSLSDAVDDRLIASNPAALVKAPARATPEMHTWRRDHAKAFLSDMQSGRLGAMWRLFLTTGMRRGEVAALRWQDVDLEQSLLMVRQTGNIIEGVWTVGTPKGRKDGTTKSRRLSLDAGTVDSLRRRKTQQLQERMAWGGDWVDTGLVFTREDGRELNPTAIGHALTAAAKRLGLPHVRVHDLRHTYATLAIEAGIHPKVVSERLGHANIGITLDLYSHVTEGMDRDAADLVAGLLS